MDCLFITASSSKEAYQDLAHKYMAIEPPTWSLLLAESCRSKGYSVGILDALAENLSDIQVVERVEKAILLLSSSLFILTTCLMLSALIGI